MLVVLIVIVLVGLAVATASLVMRERADRRSTVAQLDALRRVVEPQRTDRAQGDDVRRSDDPDR